MRVQFALDDVTQLPSFFSMTIPPDFIDLMGHMNVSYYMHLFDKAGWSFFAHVGMDDDYYRTGTGGGFALMHFIRYLAEVREGETVRLYTRVLGLNEKRVHFMSFMVNETRPAVSATMEGLGSHANTETRRTSPYPPHIAEKLRAMLTAHQALTWDAYPSGAMSVEGKPRS
jgi:acyl-CoA thioester hydrolase